MFKKFNNWVKSQEKILSQRDYQLIKKSGKIILGNVCEGQEFPWYPYRCIKPFKFPAGTQEWSNGLWNWDSAFHAMGVRRWDIQLAKEQILGFTQYQLKDGMFVDSVRKDGEIIAFSSKPPVFAYAVQKIYEQDGDIEFIKAVYPRLAKNQEFWDDLRSWKGLFHYGANLSNTNTDHFIQSIKNESGWDNSVRWDVSCSDFWAIDLNCFMIMRFRSMSFLANALGKKR